MTTPVAPNRTINLNPQPTLPGTTTPVPTSTLPAGLSPDQQNADVLLNSLLGQWGLSSLAPTALGYIQAGYDSNTVQYLLTQTPEYAQRFAGNTQRIAAGLAPLSPANYLATEDSYRQVMSAAGLPAGFYDTPTAMAGLIGSDVSGSELQSRVNEASTLVNQTDPSARQALSDYYGVTSGQLVAHFLDPTVAAPILQKQEAAAQIGGAALAQHLSVTNQQTAEQAADLGVSASQANTAESKVAQILPTEEAIGNRFGQQYSQGTAENEFLLNDAAATKQRATMNQDEQALFQSDTGLASAMYGGATRAGSLAGNTSGSF
jgi:hypothetical protein